MRKFLSLLPVLALVACASLHSPPAAASTLTVTWTNPTLNTDDSNIPDTGAESLQVARIEYGTCSASNVFGVKAGEFTRTRVTGQSMPTSATNNVPPGLTCVRVYVSNVAGKESDASNVASRTVEPSKPKPATGVVASQQL